MPGEHARSGAAGTGERVPRSGTGPRHAAPRKSLLTKLQVPAGKAIAIAAMPTAVLMGMGLTPRLAQADELPKNPFTGHSCADETPDDSSSSSPSASATPSPSSSSGSSDSKDSSGSKDSAGSSGGKDKASATPSPSANAGSKVSTSSGDDNEDSGKAASTPSASASPSPSAAKSTDPLDPLGIGDTLGSLLGGGSGSAASTPSASATPSPSATSESGSKSSSGSHPSDPLSPSSPSSPSSSTRKTVEDTAKTVEKTVEDTTGKATGAPEKAKKATEDATSAASASPSADAGAYPCPTYDAKALADADYQKTSSLLPDDPWILKTDLLTLHGLNYAGVVKVKTYDGTVKDVLKFTATGVDIRNLHQITEGPDGTKYHVQARPGSTSTFRDGTVTMYTEELKGNLFGVIPVTFSPKSPPPLNVSEVFFSDVTVTQAGQFGGTLTIPGMHIYNTDS